MLFPCLLLTILYLFYVFHKQGNNLGGGASYFILRQCGFKTLSVMKLSKKLGVMVYLN